jgi:hypothetical protein
MGYIVVCAAAFGCGGATGCHGYLTYATVGDILWPISAATPLRTNSVGHCRLAIVHKSFGSRYTVLKLAGISAGLQTRTDNQ